MPEEQKQKRPKVIVYGTKETMKRFWDFPIGGKQSDDRLNNMMDEIIKLRGNLNAKH